MQEAQKGQTAPEAAETADDAARHRAKGRQRGRRASGRHVRCTADALLDVERLEAMDLWRNFLFDTAADALLQLRERLRLLLQLLLSTPALPFRQAASHGPAYLRVLGFNERGRELLKQLKETASLPLLTNINKDTLTKAPSTAFKELLSMDLRATDLYELITKGKITKPDYKKAPVFLKQ